MKKKLALVLSLILLLALLSACGGQKGTDETKQDPVEEKIPLTV